MVIDDITGKGLDQEQQNLQSASSNLFQTLSLDQIANTFDVISKLPSKNFIQSVDDIEKYKGTTSTFEDVYTFSPELVKLFGMLTGDLNPIHHDPRFKNKSILGGLAVHGHFLNSITGACIHKIFNVPENAPYEIISRKFDANYVKAVSVNSPITMRWNIYDVSTRDGNAQVHYKIALDGIGTDGKKQECCSFNWIVRYCPFK